ncbi:hypothetical protein E2542_SST27941 [Spatholobus suberectus]|nr:hypothetical protein E2542_SST27941 [Spatholobus suberectus]
MTFKDGHAWLCSSNNCSTPLHHILLPSETMLQTPTLDRLPHPWHATTSALQLVALP